MATKKPTTGNDKLLGTSANDSINGLAGNDTITGQSGKDTLIGDTGNDSLDGGVGNDSLLGGAGRDTLRGGSDHDYLNGGADNDLLDGGAGNDTLDGGTGADTLIGGDGNDTFIVDNSADRIIEAPGRTSGTDSVKSSVDYILPANVENLELTGMDNLKGTGSDGKNLITGNAGDNVLDGKNGFDTLMGGEGDDTLMGGGGIDKLIGGDGSDTYQISSTEDTIVETAKDGDQDVVETTVSYELIDNLEVLVLMGTAKIDGTGNTLDNTLIGNDAANQLSGDAGDDSLDGGGGNDTLDGGVGNDTLDGGAGIDEVDYQGNKDTYKITFDADSQTWVVEDVNDDGVDEGTDEITNVEILRFADGVYDPSTLNRPTLSIADLTQAEGTSASPTSFDFTVSLSAPATEAVSVDYSVNSGTAMDGIDFIGSSSTVNFAPGETSQTISVPVFADSNPESDKTFTVQLANAVGADLTDTGTVATGTIRDDDKAQLSTLSIANVDIAEGDSGSKNALITVSLATPSTQTVTVNYTTSNGTASAGTDYISKSGTLTFAAGVTQQTIPIAILGDKQVEADENFAVTLSGAKNATISSTQGKALVTLRNDDLNILSIGNVSQTEGSDGNNQTANFTVKLSSPATTQVTVDYQTQGGTATDSTDFIGSSGTLVFAPGQVTQTIPVTVIADNQSESNETFSVQLSNAQGASIDPLASRGTGTIQDDDRSTLSISGTSIMEGNGAPFNAILTVNLSSPSTQMVTVKYATVDGNATASSDYMPQSGTLSFLPGTTSQQIRIPIVSDTLVESDENFKVVLSNATNADLNTATSSATVTIKNDDTAIMPTISIGNPSVQVMEGDSGTVDAVIPVKLSQASNQTITVNYSTQDGTAQGDSDYQPMSDTLIFNPGMTYQEIRIPVLGDTDVEKDENFRVILNNPGNATLNTTAYQSTVTIKNNDIPVVFIQGDRQTPIMTSEGSMVQVQVQLSAPSSSLISVGYATQDFNDPNTTAQANLDYTPTSGILTFQPGETLKTINIPTIDDSYTEGLERFNIQLSSPRSARFPTPDEEYALNGSAGREVDIQDNDVYTGPSTTTLKYHLYQGKWFKNPEHTQTVTAATVTTALKNGPATVQIDGLDSPSTIQINGWTPDDKLVINAHPEDLQALKGPANTLADPNVGILYGRHYTTTVTTSFNATSRIQQVTGALWTTTSKGTYHWIMYGTARPTGTTYQATPEWVHGLDKTLARINPAPGVYGDYLKASDISFI